MSNYENIKPYADFAHAAAQHGGVDSYLDEIETASYENGANDMFTKAVKVFVIALPLGISAWEGGKCLIKKGVNYFNDLKSNNTQKIEAAKTAIKAGVAATEEQQDDICNRLEN